MEQPINQSVITVEGSDCDKRKKYLELFKESAAFDVSDRLQAEVSRFRCRIFHCFTYFLKI